MVMKINWSDFITDYNRLKTFIDNEEFVEKNFEIVKSKLKARFGKKFFKYFVYYCCQSSYARVFIEYHNNLKEGEMLISSDGHTVNVFTEHGHIVVKKNFKRIFHDKKTSHVFEIDMVEMILKFDYKTRCETVSWI